MNRTVSILDDAMADTDGHKETEAGFGSLRTERGNLPLTAMDVQAKLSGLTASVLVRQTFHNPFEEPIEATYIFPLPDRAAVTSFTMRVAGRVVEGILKERGEARAEYTAAIQAGHRAAIAEEERSGTFSLRVGNLPPSEEATVELTLVGPLAITDAEATFRFPLVVAPRYVPGVPLNGPSVGLGVGPDTDQVPDASRVTPPVLLPGFPNPVRLSLEVDFDPAGLAEPAGGWASNLKTSLHAALIEEGPTCKIRLQPGERLNRDFLLRFPLGGPSVQTSLQWLADKEKVPGVFALTLVPPQPAATDRPRPRDIVFLLDRSGSMGGWKMVAARRALGRMIDTLLDEDRFVVIAFDTVNEFVAQDGKSAWQPGTNGSRWRTMELLGKIDARGGTEMGPALQAGMSLFEKKAKDRERIVVLVTDGQIAGEDALLATLAAHWAKPRIFALGIDRAVNAGFLQRLADLGGGRCDLVESEDRLDEAMAQIHRGIGSPTLTEVKLEPVGFELQDDSLAPGQLPDLFVGSPVTIFGRVLRDRRSEQPPRLRVRARDAAGNPWSQEVDASAVDFPALRNLWGRAKVRELEDRYAAHRERDLDKRIVAISLEAGVLSRFTAYVAVDRAEVVNPEGKPHEIIQPVELPSGWDESAIAVCASMPMAKYAPAGDVVESCLMEMPSPAPSMRMRKMAPGGASSPARVGSAASAPGFMVGKAMEFFKDLLKAKPPEPGAFSSAVGEIERALDELVRSSSRTERRSKLEILLRELDELVALLGKSRGLGAVSKALREIAKQGRKLLKRQENGEPDILLSGEFDEFLRRARAALVALKPAPPPPGDRGRFWA